MNEYKLKPFEQNETPLFFRLDGEKAERHGAIGYMRADFGRGGNEFWTTWFDNQKHLKTPDFKAELQNVVEYLREGTPYPVFSNRRDLEAFCLKYAGQRVEDRGIGFKIQTENYSYYTRCKPTPADYDIMLYAYDNRYLLPELAGQHELPRQCYSMLPSNCERILIYGGERGYIPFDDTGQSREELRREINRDNEKFGVTRAQEEAMVTGSMFG